MVPAHSNDSEIASPPPHVDIEKSLASAEKLEGDSQSFTIDGQAARLIQELLAKQLEQVKQALECNLQIASRLAVATDKVACEEVKIDSTTTWKTEMVKDGGGESKPTSGDPRIADEDASRVLQVRPPSSNDLSVPLLSNDDSEPPSPGPSETGQPSIGRWSSFHSVLNRNAAPRGAMFVDVAVVKEFVRHRLSPEQYNVEDSYFESGWAQAIARSNTFKNVTLCAIFVNTVWIGVDTDLNHADILLHADGMFQIVQNIFCLFFTFEVSTRFCAFAHKADAFKDGWFVFDSTLVLFMVWETWIVTSLCLLTTCSDAGGAMQNSSILRVMRLFRLLRASRVLRLMRSFPELMVLLQAMFAAMRSVFWTLTLLFLIIYIFAILFTQLMRDSKEAKGCFEDVLMSMNCLMLNSVFPDQKDLLETMLSHSMILYALNLLFMSLSCLTVMNLLIGVLCEVVSEVARAEKEGILAAHLQNKIRELLPIIDKDGNNEISSQEFTAFLTNQQVCRVLHEAGIDVCALAEHAAFIFRDEETVSFTSFVQMALQFRDQNAASVKELRSLRKALSEDMYLIEKNLSRGTSKRARASTREIPSDGEC
eukprot:TRINITY_DN8456_c0_g1_i1.p1 TRINITY_DN8456_c0_g1~~TRINITY_DN8456_c0_g1_i1.p1  ORF type:complete len:595 (+),score=85.65 TRINITY_DN8456_c0_g1_i1:134-1918(+)